MFKDILDKQLIFPNQIKISAELKSLLCTLLNPYLILLADLLCKNPNKRLGHRNGILDIVNDPWCKKLKLSDVMHRTIEPTIRPNPFVMYFEQFDQKQQQIVRGISFSNKDLQYEIPMENDRNFKGFYYENKQEQKKEVVNNTQSMSSFNIFSQNAINNNIQVIHLLLQANINININSP